MFGKETFFLSSFLFNSENRLNTCGLEFDVKGLNVFRSSLCSNHGYLMLPFKKRNVKSHHLISVANDFHVHHKKTCYLCVCLFHIYLFGT